MVQQKEKVSGLELKNFVKVRDMKVILEVTKKKEKEFIIGMMEIDMKVDL